MSDIPIDDGSDKPLGFLSPDGELEVRDYVDASGQAGRGYCETALGQHNRWLRQAPELFEKYVELQGTLEVAKAERDQLQTALREMIERWREYDAGSQTSIGLGYRRCAEDLSALLPGRASIRTEPATTPTFCHPKDCFNCGGLQNAAQVLCQRCSELFEFVSNRMVPRRDLLPKGER